MDPEGSYLEKEEIAAIFGAIDTKNTMGRRDYAILLFMYNSGARVQETSDLLLSWLSFEEPYKVQIFGKGRKSRTCPLWKNTVEMLKKVIANTKNETLRTQAREALKAVELKDK